MSDRLHNATATMNVLSEVLDERAAQDRTWGVQDFPWHHPVDGRGVALTGRTYAAWASMYQAECDRRRDAAKAGHADTRSNALVLLEEVFEALAETDLTKVREELIQIAAVAVKSVESIDRARLRNAVAEDRTGGVRPCETVPLPGDQAASASPAEPDSGTAVAPDPFAAAPSAVNRRGPDDWRDWPPFAPARGVPAEVVDAAAGGPDDWPTVDAPATTCTVDGCTPDYCPGGKQCHAIAPGEPGWLDNVTHREALIKIKEFERERLGVGQWQPSELVVIDCYADKAEPGQIRCRALSDHPPHEQCYGNGPFRVEPEKPTMDPPAYTGTMTTGIFEEPGPVPPLLPITEFRHPYGGDGRLHGICRCGEGRDHPVHDTGGE